VRDARRDDLIITLRPKIRQALRRHLRHVANEAVPWHPQADGAEDPVNLVLVERAPPLPCAAARIASMSRIMSAVSSRGILRGMCRSHHPLEKDGGHIQPASVPPIGGDYSIRHRGNVSTARGGEQR